MTNYDDGTFSDFSITSCDASSSELSNGHLLNDNPSLPEILATAPREQDYRKMRKWLSSFTGFSKARTMSWDSGYGETAAKFSAIVLPVQVIRVTMQGRDRATSSRLDSPISISSLVGIFLMEQRLLIPGLALNRRKIIRIGYSAH